MATAPTRPALRIPLHDDPHYYLRYWQEGDETALQRYANSHRIWDSVRDHFPHPYTLEHARQWIQLNAKPITSGVLVAAIGERILYPPQFAIVDAGNDEPIGAVG
ncbi:hypothetical protein HK102_000873 [Quaeritorhiza haematococci]|nr:hypothetical protein HK102_000873 [Quaeritorhiza haematococci]